MPPLTPTQMMKSKALWEMITHINGELQKLTPAILTPTVTNSILNYEIAVEGQAISSAPIRTLLKQNPEGGYVMLTVNLDDMPLKVSYSFEDPLEEVRVLFENRHDAEKLVDGNKSVALWYEPFDVHVLLIKPITVAAHSKSQE